MAYRIPRLVSERHRAPSTSFHLFRQTEIRSVRYTGSLMARRVLALAFALLVAVTPVANGICGVSCAEQHSGTADVPPHHHSSDVATEPSHHHHHATVEAPVSTATVAAVPHPC